jgi:hypothetical protein
MKDYGGRGSFVAIRIGRALRRVGKRDVAASRKLGGVRLDVEIARGLERRYGGRRWRVKISPFINGGGKISYWIECFYRKYEPLLTEGEVRWYLRKRYEGIFGKFLCTVVGTEFGKVPSYIRSGIKHLPVVEEVQVVRGDGVVYSEDGRSYFDEIDFMKWGKRE